ncbi:ABSCISIC ACID-INSENSITIVE 5-like protein 7 isoform X1 [Lactuca sativa]|uniref:ABSCISIC ACID-INSENSITIVE 5-like protein 7 isoform X1 n=1 Tax=Lactuca sativa TaxID=4236 RepID=UPI000CBC65A1|nr:ABSCISIC ACID-INSENSITIVE 5-like protein 7 isoform X1 [Lactuca sativa]XP_023754711.1 ABSCISIC ACID-INSENSITIVE 5-like protein 7 isoform X1 [Lactuca sativa]
MSSFINFKNCKPMVANSSLTEQSSIYALTFGELQNTFGGNGEDFGSMNIDELLKKIWTTEETQSMTSNSNLGINGKFQKQGSLILPRTISQKKVDEIWRDCLKENGGFKDVDLIKEPTIQPQEKQPTLGEMTLEAFLQRAGAISENNQTQGFKNVIQNQGFRQEAVVTEGKNDNLQGVGSSKVQKLQKILPKQSAFNFRSSVNLVNNNHMSSRENGVSIIGKIGHSIKTDYPSDLYQNGNLDMSPSPPPCYGGSYEGKRSGVLEKVVERRHKRMIKNRESAARSRARKQAYTLELEAEVEKLKEEVQKKQDEIMESQHFQIWEKTKLTENGRLCLRRTMTGPW